MALDSFKIVSNPLTVIAIFAGLSEVSMTVALAYVSPDLQHIFIWFIMVFPTLLVALFFITLNFNHRVLYAPSDFREDDAFLKVLDREKASGSLSEAESSIDAAVKVVEESLSKERVLTDDRIRVIEEKLKESKASVVSARSHLDYESLSASMQHFVDTLDSYSQVKGSNEFSASEMHNAFPEFSRPYIAQAISRLRSAGFIEKLGQGQYRLIKRGE